MDGYNSIILSGPREAMEELVSRAMVWLDEWITSISIKPIFLSVGVRGVEVTLTESIYEHVDPVVIEIRDNPLEDCMYQGIKIREEPHL